MLDSRAFNDMRMVHETIGGNKTSKQIDRFQSILAGYNAWDEYDRAFLIGFGKGALIAGAAILFLPGTVVAVLATGAVIYAGARSAQERIAKGQSWDTVYSGTVLDATGLNYLFGALGNMDYASRESLDLTELQRAEMLGEIAGGSVIGPFSKSLSGLGQRARSALSYRIRFGLTSRLKGLLARNSLLLSIKNPTKYATLFRGYSKRKQAAIIAALPEGVEIGLRPRPFLANLFDGWIQFKGSKDGKFKRRGIFRFIPDLGIRIDDPKTGYRLSDFDLAYVKKHGDLMPVSEVELLLPELNKSLGFDGFQHGDNLRGVQANIEAAIRAASKNESILRFTKNGYEGSVKYNDAVVEIFANILEKDSK